MTSRHSLNSSPYHILIYPTSTRQVWHASCNTIDVTKKTRVMTKKEIINKIFQRLSANPGYEIYVPELQNKLRAGRWGMHAYCLTLENGSIVCRPWAGAELNWPARLDRLTKDELLEVLRKCPSTLVFDFMG